MENIIRIFTSGIDNPCMSINISIEAKNKIQTWIKSKINWDDSARKTLDGVDGDINQQMPNEDSNSITYITEFDIYDIDFVNDQARDECIDFVAEIVAKAEPVYYRVKKEEYIDENISVIQRDLAERIASELREDLDYRHKEIAMLAGKASYTDGSIFLQINFELSKESADKFIGWAREVNEDEDEEDEDKE